MDHLQNFFQGHRWPFLFTRSALLFSPESLSNTVKGTLLVALNKVNSFFAVSESISATEFWVFHQCLETTAEARLRFSQSRESEDSHGFTSDLFCDVNPHANII